VATFAEGTASALASDLLSVLRQATMLAVTENANPMARIKDVCLRMS
jgi:hypothetical protein